MTPTEDEMDALNDVIRRLRSELERVREAGRIVADTFPFTTAAMIKGLLRALEGEEGKPSPQEGGE